MEPAILILASWMVGYLFGRHTSQRDHGLTYNQGYQQALIDVAQAEDQVVEAMREQARLN